MNIIKKTRHWVWNLFVIMVVTLALGACANEHPTGKSMEHPTEQPVGKQPVEHPAKQPEEHPAKQPGEHPAKQEESKGEVSKPLTKADLAEAIETYVKNDAALHGGYFLVYDNQAQKSCILALEKVHKDRLSKVGLDEYFACADFKTPEGKVYDLDIFMKGTDKDHLEVMEIALHKEDGKERYTWYEQKGIWKKKPVDR